MCLSVDFTKLTKEELDSASREHALWDTQMYKITTRGAHFVWTFYLKTKQKSSKCVLADVTYLIVAEIIRVIEEPFIFTLFVDVAIFLIEKL